MIKDQFYSELTNIVKLKSSTNNLVNTLAFVNSVAERLEGDPVFGDFSMVDWSGTGSKNKQLKLHGFTALDELDESFGLVLGKWSDSDEPDTLSKQEVESIFNTLEAFVNDSISNNLSGKIVESSSAFEAYSTIKVNLNNISKIRLHLFTNLKISARFKEIVAKKIGNISIEHHIWDYNRIKALYQSSKERESIVIKLDEFNSNGIEFMRAADSELLKSYLCILDANLLADLYERYGSRLLEGNVRSFLGMKSSVNKGIKKTLSESRAHFFAYNNGVAATASNVVITKSLFGRELITQLTDLQIVNGGQTTSSLLNARKKDGISLSGVTVAFKLTEVGIKESAKLIPKIAEYANTQNKVAAADFFSNHPFHQKMEEISRRMLTPSRSGIRIQSKWFYERSRGQYLNERLYLNVKDKNAIDLEFPSSQVINKTDLAKFDSTYRGKPYWTCLGAQSNFMKFASHFSNYKNEISGDFWEKIEKDYDEIYYQNIISISILWKKLERIISDARGTWYEGDYRAQIVAYSLATLFNICRENKNKFNLNRIWLVQKTDEQLDGVLVEIAKVVQKSILSPPQGVTNVGQWCKREKCWDSLVGLNWDKIELPNEYIV
jgi:hypothetical protein